MRSYKVLMVEDSDAEAAALAAQVAAYAKAHGIQIALSREATAFSLAERAHTFDLILLDIDLPGLTGMEAAEALREHDAQHGCLMSFHSCQQLPLQLKRQCRQYL